LREKARRNRRVAHRSGCNWYRVLIFIGSRRKIEVVYVKGKVRLCVAEDKLLSGRGLSCRPAGVARVRRIKLRQGIPYVPLPRRSGIVSAERGGEVLQLLERILVK